MQMYIFNTEMLGTTHVNETYKPNKSNVSVQKERSSVLKERLSLREERTQLQAELEKYRECDPEVVEEMSECTDKVIFHNVLFNL